MVPLSINKDVLVPSYNDLKFKIQNHNYFCSNLIHLLTRVRTGRGITDCSKSGKDYVKAVYCHPAYLTSMQSTSCKMLGWMKHKLESRILGESNVRYTDDTTLMAESAEELKNLLKAETGE